MADSDCKHVDLSPAPPAAPGIVITLGPRPVPLSPLIVHGAFLLSPDQAEAVEGEAHRSIVLLVQRGPAHNVYVPFRDRVLFADDVAALPSGTRGYFNLDVFELQGGFAAGPYHVLVSMQEQVSNMVDTYVE